MYISNLFLKNFKSFKNAIVPFGDGKNVIVGKNNSGKSNIILALEILFGERFAAYRKFDTSYFHTCKEEKGENICDYFYIDATLKGNDFDITELLSLKRSIAFSMIKSTDDIATKNTASGEIDINYSLLTSLEELSNREEVEEIKSISKANKEYYSKEKWFKGGEFIEFLARASTIKIFYCKSRLDESSGYGLLIKDPQGKYWLSHYLSQKVRDSLLTTTIIPAFRNPKDDLKVNGYNWYSKLISYLWDTGKGLVEDKIIEQSKAIRKLADSVFEDATLDLQKIIKKAISHEKVSFKLINTKREDLHKNLSIHVDDGIDQPLEHKGSGIQSAVIIALFTNYCSKFHNSSSLLVVEEPELFLHPQARRFMSKQLETYIESSDTQNRQLIISTHSVEFIRNVDIDKIILVRKETKTNESLISSINGKDKLNNDEINKIIRFLWSKNAEIFFADKVLLVEGGEEYLLHSIFDFLYGEKQILDYKNISIARVDGKGNFCTYIKILNKFNIPWVLLGDLDCYEDVVANILDTLNLDKSCYQAFKEKLQEKAVIYKKLNKEVIKNSESLDGNKLKSLFSGLKEGTITLSDENLLKFIDYLESRFTKSNIQDSIKEDSLKVEFDKVQLYLKQNNIHILSKGAIEAYYTHESFIISANSKDSRALEIANLISTKKTIKNYINDLKEFQELLASLSPDYALNTNIIDLEATPQDIEKVSTIDSTSTIVEMNS